MDLFYRLVWWVKTIFLNEEELEDLYSLLEELGSGKLQAVKHEPFKKGFRKVYAYLGYPDDKSVITYRTIKEAKFAAYFCNRHASVCVPKVTSRTFIQYLLEWLFLRWVPFRVDEDNWSIVHCRQNIFDILFFTRVLK